MLQPIAQDEDREVIAALFLSTLNARIESESRIGSAT